MVGSLANQTLLLPRIKKRGEANLNVRGGGPHPHSYPHPAHSIFFKNIHLTITKNIPHTPPPENSNNRTTTPLPFGKFLWIRACILMALVYTKKTNQSHVLASSYIRSSYIKKHTYIILIQ